VEASYLQKVIGLDLSATPERLYAIKGALQSRNGVSSPPYQAAAFNDTVSARHAAAARGGARPHPFLVTP